jgi:hypothetical protein
MICIIIAGPFFRTVRQLPAICSAANMSALAVRFGGSVFWYELIELSMR